MMLPASALAALWPEAQRQNQGLVDAICRSSDAVFTAGGLLSGLAIAHAMTQFSQECGAGIQLVENLNYSAAALLATWPARFDAARAAALAHQPESIANAVYNGRMGNQPGSDDGWTYRGRGGAQVTGRANYRALGEKTGLDLLAQPDLVNHPDHFLACAVGQFLLCGCLPFALRDDVNGVTQHLNGGLIGLSQRRDWLVRWKAALAAVEGAPPGTLWLQQRLNALGEVPPLLLDGSFGPRTAAALRGFQASQGLPADGQLTPATLAALRGA